MNAMKALRELKALDWLEKRVRSLAAPDVRLLKQIEDERSRLLKAEPAPVDAKGAPR